MRTVLSSLSLCGLLLCTACDTSPVPSVSAPPTRAVAEAEFRALNKDGLDKLTATLKRGMENGSSSPAVLLRAGASCSGFDVFYDDAETHNRSIYSYNQENPRKQREYELFEYTVNGLALCDAVDQVLREDNSRK